MDLNVLFGLSYGMYAITTQDGVRPTGCIVNSVFQVTNQEPLVALSMNRDNYTHQVLMREKRFAVSILSESTPSDVISKLGFVSGKDVDKLTDIPYSIIDGLAVLDTNCMGYLICEVVSVAETSTHDIFVAKVIAGETLNKNQPMTYSYYHNVIKGTSPKNAPSYQKATVTEREEVYVCDICNYQYKGDITKEGSDYKCPICKADVSHFKG